MADLTKHELTVKLSQGEISVEEYESAIRAAPVRNRVEYRRSPSGLFSIVGNDRRVIRGFGLHLFKGEMDHMIANWGEIVETYNAIRDTLTDPPARKSRS